MNTVVVFIIIGNFCYEFYFIPYSRNFREELEIYSNTVLNLFVHREMLKKNMEYVYRFLSQRIQFTVFVRDTFNQIPFNRA